MNFGHILRGMKVKNLLVANVREKDRRYKFKKIEILVKALILFCLLISIMNLWV
jgi:hypothetical protein